MVQGYNKANLKEYKNWELNVKAFENIKSRPCVFLIYQHEDYLACQILTKYLSNATIDYYMEEMNEDLQMMKHHTNSQQLQETIKKGISKSTHILFIVSKSIKKTNWIPLKIIYNYISELNELIVEEPRSKKIKPSFLTLSNMSYEMLPMFEDIEFTIKGTKSLNSYISLLLNQQELFLLNNNLIKSHDNRNHPLDKVLNWRL